jgi:molybdopterin converting factor small subunit
VIGSTVTAVLTELDARIPGLRERLVEAGPRLRPHINVYVAGRQADLSTPVADGDTVHVIPAVSGGARFGSSPSRKSATRSAEDR